MDNLTLSYIIIYVFVFIFGACIGSFLNVCIYRLPKNESLIKRNSHCMTCGEPIKRRDLIPIVAGAYFVESVEAAVQRYRQDTL